MKINVFKNLTLKFVALILAIMIWFLVVGEERSEVRLTVPLELRNLPTSLEIVERIGQVEVTLRGFSSIVKSLPPSEIDVHIDLSNVVRGTNSFVISPEDIRVPVGVTVTQVSPSSIDISLDATIRKTLPVEPMTRGEPVDGYALGEITSEPASITLSGAQSILKNILKVETEPISLNSVKQDFAKKAKIKLPNSSVRIEKEEEKIVSVNVKIVPEMTERFFEEIPLLVKNETRTFTLIPESITALVQGPKLQLLHMNPKDIPALIDTDSLPEGQSIVQVHFDLPESMNVKIYYPKTIVINISGKS